MKITKHTIRGLVLEELKSLKENEEITSSKSLAIQAMKRIKASKIAVDAITALKDGGDDVAKHEFLSEMANILGVDIASDVGRIKTQQARMGGVPQEEEPVQEQQVTEK
jgi:hypothetical protein